MSPGIKSFLTVVILCCLAPPAEALVSGDCYVDYALGYGNGAGSACTVAGFAVRSSLGTWGYCSESCKTDDGGMRPPGGRCPTAWGGCSAHHVAGEAYLCCDGSNTGGVPVGEPVIKDTEECPRSYISDISIFPCKRKEGMYGYCPSNYYYYENGYYGPNNITIPSSVGIYPVSDWQAPIAPENLGYFVLPAASIGTKRTAVLKLSDIYNLNLPYANRFRNIYGYGGDYGYDGGGYSSSSVFRYYFQCQEDETWAFTDCACDMLTNEDLDATNKENITIDTNNLIPTYPR